MLDAKQTDFSILTNLKKDIASESFKKQDNYMVYMVLWWTSTVGVASPITMQNHTLHLLASTVNERNHLTTGFLMEPVLIILCVELYCIQQGTCERLKKKGCFIDTSKPNQGNKKDSQKLKQFPLGQNILQRRSSQSSRARIFGENLQDCRAYSSKFVLDQNLFVQNELKKH